MSQILTSRDVAKHYNHLFTLERSEDLTRCETSKGRVLLVVQYGVLLKSQCAPNDRTKKNDANAEAQLEAKT